MLDFHAWESFCKGIGNHIFDVAIDKFEFSIGDNPAYEVEVDVDVLYVYMVFECNCALIISVECCQASKFPKDFPDQGSEPEHLAVWVVTTYSASVIDNAMISCFPELHKMAPPSRRKHSFPVFVH